MLAENRRGVQVLGREDTRAPAPAATAAGRFTARRRSPPAPAVLMLLAPQNLDAAYWFSASTDLLATVFVLGSLIAIVRGRLFLVGGSCARRVSIQGVGLRVAAAGAAGAARPAVAARLAAIAPQLALLAAVLVVRVRVLHGWGGGGRRARRALGTKLFQIASGLAHVFTGDGVMPEVLAFGVGTAIVALAAFAAIRRRKDDGGAGSLPLAFCALAAAPLLAAGWAVGARYFYLPAVGLAWAAAEALASAGHRGARRDSRASVVIVGGVQARAAARRRGLLRPAGGGGPSRGRLAGWRPGTASSTS